MATEEKWKRVIGFPEYLVSDMGNVRSLKYGKVKPVSQWVNKGGYLRVTIYGTYGRKHLYVHQVVAMAFVENDDPLLKDQVDHINNFKDDNRAVNLRWTSYEENQKNRRDRKCSQL